MAHLMKLNRNQIGGLTRHFERHKKENGDYIKFGNQDIDTEKTRLNYNLAEEKNQLIFIQKRISEVRCLNRKDVNVMCDWVVTLPEKIKTEEDQKIFFRETYTFLEKEYGKENVVSSFVHLDETTPHMHFAFIPVVTDKKRGDLKVSAKELITRKHLQEFHPKLENYMKVVFNRDIGILNEATKEGNQSVQELKQGTASKKIKELNKDIEKKTIMINNFNENFPKLKNEIENELKDIKEQLENKLQEVNKAQKKLDNVKADIDYSLNSKKTLESEIGALKVDLKTELENISSVRALIMQLKDYRKVLEENNPAYIHNLMKNRSLVASENEDYKDFIRENGLEEDFDDYLENINQRFLEINFENESELEK